MTFGPYEILEQTGIEGGGFDALARGEDGKEVRLWAGAEGTGADPDRVAAQVPRISKVFHSSLPRVTRGDVIENRAVFVVPVYRGRLLRQRLADGPVDPPEALDWLRVAAAGLVKAHKAGVVHGAVGPDTVLLADDGRTLLLYLGMAPFLGERAARAPEDEGRPGGSESGDVYGLSRALAECLTGQDPYPQSGPAPQESDFPPTLPEGLRRFLARAVRAEPDGRIHRAEEFSGDLGVIRASWEAASTPPRKAIPLRRFRLALWLPMALGIALISALLVRSCGS
ncbi:MAG: hypothetical protein HKN12_06045 [Gemmatimonadetes bacterium]|nr:hypothetical protein [Gemmatimonadota bacterium]